MRKRIYLRISNYGKGKVIAGLRPNYEPLSNGYPPADRVYYPTVMVALDLDIPEKEFDVARILLQAKISETKPAVEIKQVKGEELE